MKTKGRRKSLNYEDRRGEGDETVSKSIQRITGGSGFKEKSVSKSGRNPFDSARALGEKAGADNIGRLAKQLRGASIKKQMEGRTRVHRRGMPE